MVKFVILFVMCQIVWMCVNHCFSSTEVVFKVVERADNGMTKTYPSNDVYNALNQANVKVSYCVFINMIQ